MNVITRISVSLAAIALLSATAFAQDSSSAYKTRNTSAYSLASEITNGPVAETVTDSNALIGWSSSSASNSMAVKYGTDQMHLTRTADAVQNSNGKNHHARLHGLNPNTRYYFQVVENGSPVGGVGTFRTVGAGESPIQSKAVISQQ